MAQMQGSSLVNASFSGSQQDGGGVVEFRYPAHDTSFAAHDGGDWASATIVLAATIIATTVTTTIAEEAMLMLV